MRFYNNDEQVELKNWREANMIFVGSEEELDDFFENVPYGYEEGKDLQVGWNFYDEDKNKFVSKEEFFHEEMRIYFNSIEK